MPTPGEYKTVQARILAYAQEIGWTHVPRVEAERRRGMRMRNRRERKEHRDSGWDFSAFLAFFAVKRNI
jgi:hypothetical protein